MAYNICPLHQTTYLEGTQCMWCQKGMEPFTRQPRPEPPAPPAALATPTKADDHVALYRHPWARPWFQDYMDSQPAPGAHTLEIRETGYLVTYHYEWGGMAVRGPRAAAACPDLLGWLVLGVDETGTPTAALVSRHGEKTVPFSERHKM